LIIVDTSVWAGHLRRHEPRLAEYIIKGRVLVHPFVLGEVAMGSMPDWDRVIVALRALPAVAVVGEEKWLSTVRELNLQGSGLGFVDTHLLAAARETPAARLWTRDKKFQSVAAELDLAFAP
jgi:hypothetical protein